MVDVIFEPDFKRKFKKIKDKSVKGKVIKHIAKIKKNLDVGKPMKYSRRGTRELHIPPFRLSYIIKEKTIYILDLYHKDKQ